MAHVCESQATDIRNLFFLLHGPGVRKGKVAVFFGYLDSSNTHADARLWTQCGFLGDELAFENFDAAWKAVLDNRIWPRRVNRFHTYDCVHGLKEFEGWRFADRLRMCGDLIGVVTSLPLLALGSAVITEDFKKLSREEIELLHSENFDEPLSLCLQHVFQRAISLTNQTDAKEEISLLFDNEDKSTAERCFEFCNLYQKNGFGKWLKTIAFANSADYSPLQAADLLAYGLSGFLMAKRYEDFREPDLQIVPLFSRMVSEVLAQDIGGFDVDCMKALALEIRKRQTKNIKS